MLSFSPYFSHPLLSQSVRIPVVHWLYGCMVAQVPVARQISPKTVFYPTNRVNAQNKIRNNQTTTLVQIASQNYEDKYLMISFFLKILLLNPERLFCNHLRQFRYFLCFFVKFFCYT